MAEVAGLEGLVLPAGSEGVISPAKHVVSNGIRSSSFTIPIFVLDQTQVCLSVARKGAL